MDVEDEEHDQNYGGMEGFISSARILEGDADGKGDDDGVSLPDSNGEGDQVEWQVPDPIGKSVQGVVPNRDHDNNPDDDRLDILYKKSGLSDQDKLRWRVAKAFFDERGLIADHINSYNNFVKKGIHDMFEEAQAEPFEVEIPVEERFSGKKIFVHFGKVEIDMKPEVENKDRVVEWKGPSGMDAFGKGDKGKGLEADALGKGKMSWLVDTDAPDWAGNKGAGGSGTKADYDNRADKVKRGEQNGHSGKDKRKLDSSDSDRQDVTGKGKAKAVDMDCDTVDLSDDEDEEDLPPAIVTKETFDDGSDQSDLMDVDDNHRGRAGRANILDSPPSCPSSPVRANGHAARRTSNGGTSNGVHDDGSRTRTTMNGSHAMANGGKTAGTSDPCPSSPPLSMPRSRKGNLKLMPMEARIRGMTYAAPIYCEVTIETRLPTNNKRQKSSSSTASPSYKSVFKPDRVLLGKIPVMVKSSLCHLEDSHISTDVKGDCALDPGGYFIIRGSEKVIVAQEERNQKRLWVHQNKGAYVAQCIPRRKGFGNYNYRRTLVRLDVPKKTGANAGTGRPVITITVVGVDAIPMGVYFSALGVSTDKAILELICYDFNDTQLMDVVVPSLVESDEALEVAMKDFKENSFEDVESRKAKKVAVHLIGSKSVRKTGSEEKTQEDTLRDIREKLLPHLNPSNRSKALYLGYMIRTVCLCYLGREKTTEKDDFKNKRLDFAGEVISHHFRKLMGTMQNTMKKRMQKHLVKGMELGSPTKYLDEKVITRGLKAAFSSGNWQGHDQMKNSGIVFDLKRGNPISGICQLREVRQFVPATIRLGDEARHPTFTQWGRVCPIDTPDGDDCGLVKNMAITGVVTSNTPEKPVLDICEEYNMTELSQVKGSTLQHFHHSTRVFVNGRWAGSIGSKDADALVEALRYARRSVHDLTQIEVAHNPINSEIHISTDQGRVVRPLLIVSNGHLVLSDDHRIRMKELNLPAEQCFRWLLEHQVVELLGIEEEEKAMIALQVEDLYKDNAPKFTHAEVHPSLMLGLSASLIPFPNRNQSSRNLYQAHKHCKQAIGLYSTNISSRTDTSGHHLFYPQVQLVQTNTFQSLDKKELFSGQNAIVAIACYTGYNQEDSIIMDQSSLDRGMFRTTHYRTVKNVEKPDYETFGKPPEDEDQRNSRSLEKLEEDGFPGIGVSLGVHDTIVGKVAKPQYNAEPSARTNDPSQRLKAHERGCVSQVMLLSDEDGNRVAKVKLRESRMPQVGDKFSSMHGQKGIVGMTFTQEDLPFTCEGIVPDIIINPHAFPSRQTLGQMYESALGKVIASKGIRRFATPFNPACTVETIAEALHEAGYERWGSETLCNGFTGEPMEAMIFMGTTFYQRLDHMVEDKLKFRSRGHVHPLTRQPVADRKRNGGVKFGEMERDCLIAHGASATLQERSFILSDFHTVHVCTNCEQLASRNADRLPVCRHCVKGKGKKKTNPIVKVELPYACKLLMQELMSMGISVRLKTQQL